MIIKDPSHSSMPILRVEGLSIALPAGADRDLAVMDVSFTVAPSETVCLVGESGSGKSVISKAVMGLLPGSLKHAGGRIFLGEEDITKASAEKLRQLRGTKMAMVFQEPMTALNPVMRCGDQVAEMFAAHTSTKAKEIKEKVLSLFGRVRLPDPIRVFDSYPHQLSGGQRQRIVIAIALALRPKLLICDEPTTALDVTTQAEILSLIREMQEETGTGVVFITHDFGVVAEIADRVVVLRLGSQVESGTRNAVLQQPTQPYTQMLLAAVPTLNLSQRTSVDTSKTALLQARKIGKTYDSRGWFRGRKTVVAAREVSFSLHARETVGIVGESGSGKSTVARCVAGLIEPSAGEVFAFGRRFETTRRAELSEFRKHVQVVFQDPYRSLNPRRTIGASIIEGPMNFGVSRKVASERARELMHLVRLDPTALKRYPSEFSGGQRQRICIARALAMEPQVLVADEAVSALDVSVQAQILELLNDIQSRLNIGILFITHDLRVASQICDRVLVMHQGQVVEQGTAEQVLLHPQQDYTRRLLMAAPGRGFRFGARAEPAQQPVLADLPQ